jgi:hypothetical protein
MPAVRAVLLGGPTMMKPALLSVAFALLAAACGTSATEPSSRASSAVRDWGGSSGSTGSSSGGSAPSGVVVACANEGDPSNTCTSPEHCCFSNYTAAHDGYCTTADCFYGTINCDGPEDCGAGEVCCASALSDPADGTYGYDVSCRSGACGGTVLEHELCHPGGVSCSNPNAACVPAAGNDNDLPRDLSICL